MRTAGRAVIAALLILLPGMDVVRGAEPKRDAPVAPPVVFRDQHPAQSPDPRLEEGAGKREEPGGIEEIEKGLEDSGRWVIPENRHGKRQQTDGDEGERLLAGLL
jgi:hypothetical protein